MHAHAHTHPNAHTYTCAHLLCLRFRDEFVALCLWTVTLRLPPVTLCLRAGQRFERQHCLHFFLLYIICVHVNRCPCRTNIIKGTHAHTPDTFFSHWVFCTTHTQRVPIFVYGSCVEEMPTHTYIYTLHYISQTEKHMYKYAQHTHKYAHPPKQPNQERLYTYAYAHMYTHVHTHTYTHVHIHT